MSFAKTWLLNSELLLLPFLEQMKGEDTCMQESNEASLQAIFLAMLRCCLGNEGRW